MTIKQFGKFFASLILALTLAACAATPKQESTGQYFDDTTLTAKVKAAFVNDPVVSAMAVNVETFKGIVQLSGFVKSTAERDRAVELARNVAGVRQVKNDILIR